MASLPGMNGDVFFGDAERELPDWRKSLPDAGESEEADELTAEEREGFIGILGFDPAKAGNGGLPPKPPVNGKRRRRSPVLRPSRLRSKSLAGYKGVFDSVQAAGRWLADKWAKLENRYGRGPALAMAVSSVLTFPIPGNITAIVGVAEAIRGLHGYFATNQ